MQTIKSDFQIFKDAKRLGLVGTLSNCFPSYQTENAKVLSNYFSDNYPNNFNGLYGENDWEEKLDNINYYIEQYGVLKDDIQMVYTDNSTVHLLPITDNLQLRLLVCDKYCGNGEYEIGVVVDYFIINEFTTTKDIDNLIDILLKYNIS